MIPAQIQKIGKAIGKLAFAAACCTAALSYAVARPFSRSFDYLIQIGEPPSIATPLVVSLSLLLIFALWVGVRGKPWASWAILAYGSWMVIPCGTFFHILWYTQDVLASLWFGPLTQGLILLFLFWGGMNAALRSRWKAMGGWWLVSCLIYTGVFLPQQMYASYYALERQRARQAIPINFP